MKLFVHAEIRCFSVSGSPWSTTDLVYLTGMRWITSSARPIVVAIFRSGRGSGHISAEMTTIINVLKYADVPQLNCIPHVVFIYYITW